MSTLPEPGSIWEHPSSRNSYMIHSLSGDDKWVRYYYHHPSIPSHDCYPLYTQPIDRFVGIYRKRDNGLEL